MSKQRTRRVAGLVLRRTEDKFYVTEDGQWEIGYVRGSTVCEAEHPMRDGTYCYGNADHDTWDWCVYSDFEGSSVWLLEDTFPTLREAAEYVSWKNARKDASNG